MYNLRGSLSEALRKGAYFKLAKLNITTIVSGDWFSQSNWSENALVLVSHGNAVTTKQFTFNIHSTSMYSEL